MWPPHGSAPGAASDAPRQGTGPVPGTELAPVLCQQPGHEHHELERDVKDDTIGQHAEPSRSKVCLNIRYVTFARLALAGKTPMMVSAWEHRRETWSVELYLQSHVVTIAGGTDRGTRARLRRYARVGVWCRSGSSCIIKIACEFGIAIYPKDSCDGNRQVAGVSYGSRVGS